MFSLHPPMRPRRHPIIATGSIAAVAIGLGACGSRTNLVCERDVTFTHQVPNLYFVLDHSRSMRENGKWDSVKSSVGTIVAQLGPLARFGAAIFPDPQAVDCTVGTEVMSVRPGDGAAAQTLIDAMAPLPNGGTPTAATLASLVPRLSALDGQTFVILATDGGPNCNANLACDITACTANIDQITPRCLPNTPPNCCDPEMAGGLDCLDDQATVSAVTGLRNAGIPTFVVGVPGSEAYGQALDNAAQAGGTAKSGATAYYRVDTADAQALSAALSQVIRRVTSSCFLQLATSVSADEVAITVGTTRVSHSADNGFTIEPGKNGGVLLALHGPACDWAATGLPVRVHATDECPRK